VAVFSGTQTVFSTASKLDLTGNSNLTVEFFMRLTSTNKGMMMVEQTNPYWQNTGAFMVDVNETGTGTVMGGYCTLAAGTKLNLDITPTNAASDGLWHHVAIVYNKTKTGADRPCSTSTRVAQGTYLSYTNDANATTSATARSTSVRGEQRLEVHRRAGTTCGSRTRRWRRMNFCRRIQAGDLSAHCLLAVRRRRGLRDSSGKGHDCGPAVSSSPTAWRC
jgi:hypothetical protein